MKRFAVLGVMVLGLACARADGPGRREPIIDAHLHAEPIWQDNDQSWYPKHLETPSSEEELMRRTLVELDRYNIVKAVTSSDSLERLEKYQAAAPGRIIPALLTDGTEDDLVALRGWFQSGRLAVLGELTAQYAGSAPNGAALEAYWKLAEEMDIPVGIHIGLGPPGTAFTDAPGYRMGLSRPLLLEEVLLRHPKLRVYVMHAGWPMLDEMVALMYQFPQVYVDVGVINWYIPRAEFHSYLRRLVEAGFAERILFGSDQMQWPGAIGLAVEAIDSASFLTTQQKRDIFYNNAVRFFRLEKGA